MVGPAFTIGVLRAVFLVWYAGDKSACARWKLANVAGEGDDGIGSDKIRLSKDPDRDEACELGRCAVQGFGQEIACSSKPL